MASEEISLADLRREIDRIDDSIHDLVMLRAELVDEIRRMKVDDGIDIYRPAREAEVMRRLVGRHKGNFPKKVLVRMWREMMSALVRMQGPFSVAVCDGEGDGYRELARDHFGGETPLIAQPSPRAVIHAVSEGAASVGVVPLPQHGEQDPWWRGLAGQGEGRPAIVARMPFVVGRTRRSRTLSALIVGCGAQDATGDDHSFVVVESSGAVSGASLTDMLEMVGLKPAFFTGWSGSDAPPAPVFLAEVADFVAPGDERIAGFVEGAGEAVRDVRVIGGFATPIEIDDAAGGEREGRGGAPGAAS